MNKMLPSIVLGQVIKDISVVHVEKPDLVWVSLPSDAETDHFLEKVATF